LGLNNFLYKIPAIIWAITLFTLSSLPGRNVPSVGLVHEDLIAHVIVFGLFGYFLAMAFIAPNHPGSKKRILFAILVGTIYAFSDEYHQSFVPGRFPSVSDFLADTVGLVLGAWLFTTLPLFRKRETSTNAVNE
jgi:VanZ family protein